MGPADMGMGAPYALLYPTGAYVGCVGTWYCCDLPMLSRRVAADCGDDGLEEDGPCGTDCARSARESRVE